ncbi:PucR family transcriptional regulator ligand-binding domain-containing protein, partial [Lysinibacillus telephonicus]
MHAVKTLLNTEGLAKCNVVAGEKGLDRYVKNITIMEVPEVSKWLKGNEIILTSLYAIKDDEHAIANLIYELDRVNASALAIKTVYLDNKVPESIIQSGNTLNFPIILIPKEIKYLDIMSPVLNLIMNDSSIDYKKIELAMKMLNEISLEVEGYEYFMNTLKRFIDFELTIESEISYVLTGDNHYDIQPITEEQIQELLIIKKPVPMQRNRQVHSLETVISPIIVDGKYYGNITSWAPYREHLESDILLLEKAVSILSFEFLKKKVRIDIEQQYESDFFKEIVYSESLNQRNIEIWGKKYNLSTTIGYQCLIITNYKNIDAFRKDLERNKYRLSEAIKKIHHYIIVAFTQESISIALPKTILEGDILDKIQELLKKLLIHHSSSIVIGVGQELKGIVGMKKSFKQAEKALQLANQTNRLGIITHYDEIGTRRLIFELGSSEELLNIYNETILMILDDEKGFELVKTLECYFNHDESLKITSDCLYIHVNTLKYRLKRMEELTGLSFKRVDDRTMFYIGCIIHESRQS